MSNLTGVTPSHTEKRLKLLLFGAAGTGKTTAAISFPTPYIIDAERGTEQASYVDLIKEAGGVVVKTTSFEVLMDQVRALATEEHPYRTLVVDPITVLFDNLADRYEASVGTQYGAHRAAAFKDWKRLCSLLSSLDMNVVMTAHEKTLWSDSKAMEAIGYTFDGPKKADHYMDLVCRITKEDGDRIAEVVKSRIAAIEEEVRFPWSFERLAELYGPTIIWKLSESVRMVSEEELAALDTLILMDPEGGTLRERIKQKASVERLEDLTQEQVGACIQWLKTKNTQKN